MGILLLLALRANRSPCAWLIGLPLLLLAGIRVGFRQIGSGLPTELGMFTEAFDALAFGIAAIWLTGHLYGPRHRLLGFLGMLGVLAGSSVVVAAAKFTSDDGWSDGPWSVILLGFFALVLPAALSLSALFCRGRYRPAGLFVGLMVWLPVVMIVLTSPFVLLAALASEGGALWGEYLGGMLLLGACLVGTLAPFLILSFVHPFFRTRLQELLRLEKDTPPSVLSPLPLSASPTVTSPDASPASAGAPLPPSKPEDTSVGSSPSP